MANPKWFMIDDDGGSDATPSCFPGDPRPFTPAWAALINPVAIPEVDQYGFLGFPETRQHVDPLPTQNWDVCPWDDFCDGPRLEGIAQADRYVTRWQTFLQGNAFGTWDLVYSQVGSPLIPAPVALFPGPLPMLTEWITLCFDANARPCWAWDNSAGLIELRRFVGGLPVTHNFAGHSPRLLFDGILQFDNTQTDIVCFYERAGWLYARFQRDNFGIEYLIANLGIGAGIEHLSKTDLFVEGGLYYQRLYLLTLDSPQLKIALRSAPYPPWPVRVAEPATVGVTPAGGLYFPVVLPTGPYADAGTAGVTPAASLYFPVILPTGPYPDAGTAGVTPAGGSYPQVILPTGPYPDAGTAGVTPAGGSYPQVIVPAGNYADAGTAGVTPAGGSYV